MDKAVKSDVAKGLAKLADAIHDLRKAQDAVEAVGSEADMFALQLARVLNHLGEAVADVTPEMWAAMLSESSVGIEEVRKALEAAA
jgi:hypothetical protein